MFSFQKKLYKAKYLLKAKRELENDEWKKIKLIEKEDTWIVQDENDMLKLADYYIYIYNENN